MNVIPYYFQLRAKMTWRWIKEKGIHPLIFIPLILIGSVAALKLLTDRSEYADTLLVIGGWWMVSKSTGGKELTFLKGLFSKRTFSLILAIEVLLISLPVILSLVWMKEWLALALSVVWGMLFRYNAIQVSTSWVVPTPFSRQPFEAVEGFRRFWPAWIVLVIAMPFPYYVDNSNLGLFILFATIFLFQSFFQVIEPSYFVWFHKHTPASFIWMKMRWSIVHLSIWMVTQALLFIFLFNEVWWHALVVYAIGVIWMPLLIVAKYAIFPASLPIPEGIAVGLSMIFPPLMIVTVPYFYLRASRNLQPLLA